MSIITFAQSEINKFKLVPKKGWYLGMVTKVKDGRKSDKSEAIIHDVEIELRDPEVQGTIISCWPNDKMQAYAAKFYSACMNMTVDELMKDAASQEVDMKNCLEQELMVEVSHRKSDKGDLQNEATDFAPMKAGVRGDAPFGE